MNEQLAIPMLAGLAAMALGAAVLLAKWARRMPMQERLRKLEEAWTTQVAKPQEKSSPLHDLLARIGSALGGRGSVSLQQQLSQAGYHNPTAAARYIGAKFLLFASGVIIVLAMPFHGALHT